MQAVRFQAQAVRTPIGNALPVTTGNPGKPLNSLPRTWDSEALCGLLICSIPGCPAASLRVKTMSRCQKFQRGTREGAWVSPVYFLRSLNPCSVFKFLRVRIHVPIKSLIPPQWLDMNRHMMSTGPPVKTHPCKLEVLPLRKAHLRNRPNPGGPSVPASRLAPEQRC